MSAASSIERFIDVSILLKRLFPGRARTVGVARGSTRRSTMLPTMLKPRIQFSTVPQLCKYFSMSMDAGLSSTITVGLAGNDAAEWVACNCPAHQ